MKRHTLRLILFIILATAVFNGVWWLLVPLAGWYVFRYPAYELILIGFCIDVHFAPSLWYFYYTLAAVALVGLGAFTRPLLRNRFSSYA